MNGGGENSPPGLVLLAHPGGRSLLSSGLRHGRSVARERRREPWNSPVQAALEPWAHLAQLSLVGPGRSVAVPSPTTIHSSGQTGPGSVTSGPVANLTVTSPGVQP